MFFRLALRALLLAGRAPWLAFFNRRCGLAMRQLSYFEMVYGWLAKAGVTINLPVPTEGR
jgi:hypothetical protein